MRKLLQILSFVALTGVILPSVLFFTNDINLEQTKNITLAATLTWFLVTPMWMGRQDSSDYDWREQP